MLTVALELGYVVAEANRIVGYMDAAAGNPAPSKYVELSVSLMLTRLKLAVEALDVVGSRPPDDVWQRMMVVGDEGKLAAQSTEVRVWAHPSEPGDTRTGVRLGLTDRVQEGDLVAVKYVAGWHNAGSLAFGTPPPLDGDRYIWVRPVKE